MPHTDTNISRDALRSYGMQPARRLTLRSIRRRFTWMCSRSSAVKDS